MERPQTYKEFRKKYKPIKNVNREHQEHLSVHERFALWITQNVGSVGFFALILLWTLGWLVWNVCAPAQFRFDPFPAFVLWLFISNMIQLILMPLIMIGQNLESRHSEARAEADFEVNTKSEQEIELILAHLEYQEDLIEKLLK
jgi:uncharacterized membrane protein